MPSPERRKRQVRLIGQEGEAVAAVSRAAAEQEEGGSRRCCGWRKRRAARAKLGERDTGCSSNKRRRILQELLTLNSNTQSKEGRTDSAALIQTFSCSSSRCQLTVKSRKARAKTKQQPEGNFLALSPSSKSLREAQMAKAGPQRAILKANNWPGLRDREPHRKLRELTEPRAPSPHQYQSSCYRSCDQTLLCVADFEQILNAELSFLNSLITSTMSYELLQKGRILSSLKNEVWRMFGNCFPSVSAVSLLQFSWVFLSSLLLWEQHKRKPNSIGKTITTIHKVLPNACERVTNPFYVLCYNNSMLIQL